MKAEYTATLGDRRINAVMNAAKLAKAVYWPAFYVLTWSDGEHVTEERARNLCQPLKEAINSAIPECECVSVEFVRLFE